MFLVTPVTFHATFIMHVVTKIGHKNVKSNQIKSGPVSALFYVLQKSDKNVAKHIKPYKVIIRGKNRIWKSHRDVIREPVYWCVNKKRNKQ